MAIKSEIFKTEDELDAFVTRKVGRKGVISIETVKIIAEGEWPLEGIKLWYYHD